MSPARTASGAGAAAPIRGRHNGLVVALSGGSAGIGQAIAVRLAAEGARVGILDRDDSAETLQLLRAAGSEGHALRCDIADPDAVQTAGAELRARLGAPLALIHCAALQTMKPFAEISVAEWRATQQVNLDGGFHMVRTFLGDMQAARWGRIVMVASSSFFAPPPRMSHYIASKGALLGMVRGLAAELGEWHITVNALAPGLTRTANAVRNVPQAHFEFVMGRQAVKRSGEPEDQAAAASFLLSDDSAFMSGQTLLVDGGEGHV